MYTESYAVLKFSLTYALGQHVQENSERVNCIS